MPSFAYYSRQRIFVQPAAAVKRVGRKIEYTHHAGFPQIDEPTATVERVFLSEDRIFKLQKRRFNHPKLIYSRLNPQTATEFDQVIAHCRALFVKKAHDYGTAWRILRTASLTDQIFIKASRIRSIEEKGTQKIADDLNGEFVGMVNYCLMALIQLHLGSSTSDTNLPAEQAITLYDKEVAHTKQLMLDKNHDYGEAWRDMRVSSFTDLILMKLLRIKQIEDNAGKTLVSEGVDANYRDILNYAVFALIKSGYTA